MLIGEAPWVFMVEIIGRAVIIYVILLVAMRLMGKRIGSQMTQTELAVVVTLGAAIGVPLQAPDRGILPAFIILAIAIAFQRGLNAVAARRRGVELLTQGDVSVLVEDGRLLIDNMLATTISKERLFSVLRTRGVEQLGQVRRVYFESDGDFSVFLADQPGPGLSIVPEWDERMRELARPAPGCFVCRACGDVLDNGDMPSDHCSRCGHCDWTEARYSTDEKHELR
jgi:uncharacterized membrane protein YcaP (DUF421 family)